MLLEIENFKSFVGRHSTFLTDFTAIIGLDPGLKSDLIEAISFVLNVEDHVTEGDMEDLICSKSVKAIITLNWQDEEGNNVSLSRSLSNDLNSEWSLNGNIVSRVDYDAQLNNRIGALRKKFIISMDDVACVASGNPERLGRIILQMSGFEEYLEAYLDAKREKMVTDDKFRIIEKDYNMIVKKVDWKHKEMNRVSNHDSILQNLKETMEKYYSWQLSKLEVESNNQKETVQCTESGSSLQKFDHYNEAVEIVKRIFEFEAKINNVIDAYEPEILDIKDENSKKQYEKLLMDELVVIKGEMKNLHLKFPREDPLDILLLKDLKENFRQFINRRVKLELMKVKFNLICSNHNKFIHEQKLLRDKEIKRKNDIGDLIKRIRTQRINSSSDNINSLYSDFEVAANILFLQEKIIYCESEKISMEKNLSELNAAVKDSKSLLSEAWNIISNTGNENLQTVQQFAKDILIRTEKVFEQSFRLDDMEVKALDLDIKNANTELETLQDLRSQLKKIEEQIVRIESGVGVGDGASEVARLNISDIRKALLIEDFFLSTEPLNCVFAVEDVNGKSFNEKTGHEEQISRLWKLIGKNYPNMTSPDQYKNLKEMEQAELKNLKKAKSTKKRADTAYRHLSDRRRTLYKKSLNHLRNKIRRNYQRLTKSPNIHAHISKTFSHGINYTIVPPNRKHVWDTRQLSGSEATLVALAFLFSAHSYEPPPVFLLDEVDAALNNPDAVNVADYIKLYWNEKKNSRTIVSSRKRHFYDKSSTLIMVCRDKEIGSNATKVDLTRCAGASTVSEYDFSDSDSSNSYSRSSNSDDDIDGLPSFDKAWTSGCLDTVDTIRFEGASESQYLRSDTVDLTGSEDASSSRNPHSHITFGLNLAFFEYLMVGEEFIYTDLCPAYPIKKGWWCSLLGDLALFHVCKEPVIDNHDWLDKEHINWWTNHLLRTTQSAKWSILPSFVQIPGRHLIKYADGTRNPYPSLSNVDLLFIPIHRGTSNVSGHWLLAMIDMRTWAITLYDSFGKTNVENYLRHFTSRVLPLLLSSSRCPERPSTDFDWQFNNYVSVPRQPGAGDCGVMVCMFIESLAQSNGQTVHNHIYNRTTVRQYRQHMANVMYSRRCEYISGDHYI